MIEVEDNPRSALSCIVRWTTEEPATSRVEVVPVSGPAFAVGDDAAATEHEVWVIGMHAETRYTMEAVSATAGGSELRSEAVGYETGPLPFAALRTAVDVLQPGRMEPGWTLTNVTIGGDLPVIAAIFDAEGEVVWYHLLAASGGRPDVEVGWVADERRVTIGGAIAGGTRPLEVDLAGRTHWEGPLQPEGDELLPPGGMHHAFRRNADDTYLTLRYAGEGAGIHDAVEMVDAEGDVVWAWNVPDELNEESGGYTWGNAATARAGEDAVYYHSRDLDRLFRVDGDSGSLVWSLGQDGDFAPDPTAEHPWFEDAHGPSWLEDGHLLLYDNGGQRHFSRVLELAVDDQAFTTSIVWEYPGDLVTDEWWSFHLGDADRLPNGNTLITAGALTDDSSSSRIFEVTEGGEMVWQMWMWADGEGPASMASPYAAERIPALVEGLE